MARNLGFELEPTSLMNTYTGNYDGVTTSIDNPGKVWVKFNETSSSGGITGRRFYHVVSTQEFNGMKLEYGDKVTVNRLGKISKLEPARRGH